MFLTLLGASAAAAGRTGAAVVALGLATTGAGVVPVTGGGGGALGVGATGAAVATTRGAGSAALGLAGAGTGAVRVAAAGSAALGVGSAGGGQLLVRGSAACGVGLGAGGRGGRVIAVRIIDRSGVRLLAVDQSARRLGAADSTGVAVVPLFAEDGGALLTEAGDLLELEEAGVVALTLPWRLAVTDASAARAGVALDASAPRLTVREAPPIPSAAR